MSITCSLCAMAVRRMTHRCFAGDATLLKQSGFAAGGSQHDGDPGGPEQLGSVVIDGDNA